MKLFYTKLHITYFGRKNIPLPYTENRLSSPCWQFYFY